MLKRSYGVDANPFLVNVTRWIVRHESGLFLGKGNSESGMETNEPVI